MYVRAGSRYRGLGDLTAVAQAIQQQEGYFPGSIAYTHNNPGNLTPAGQPGCTPSGGYCSFPSYAAGYQALLNQIQLDASRGFTISQFTAKYAPAAAGNDPVTYANNIAAAAGLSPGDLLSTAIAGGTSVYDLGLTTDYATTAGGAPADWLGAAAASLGTDPTTLLVGAGLLALGLWVIA